MQNNGKDKIKKRARRTSANPMFVSFGNDRLGLDFSLAGGCISRVEDKQQKMIHKCLVDRKDFSPFPVWPFFSFEFRKHGGGTTYHKIDHADLRFQGYKKGKNKLELLEGADELSVAYSTKYHVNIVFHFLCFRNEELIYFEPEIINNTGRNIEIRAIRSSLCLSRGEEYTFDSYKGHYVFQRGSHGLALWYPLGYGDASGRIEYLDVQPKYYKNEVDNKLYFEIPILAPRTGWDDFQFLTPFSCGHGYSVRLFGYCLSAGKVTGDGFALIRNARKRIFYRGHKKTELPLLGWSTWHWPLDHFDKERGDFAGSKLKIYPLVGDGCNESYVLSQLDRIKKLPFELIWLDLQPLTGEYDVDEEKFTRHFFDCIAKEGYRLNFILIPTQMMGSHTSDGKKEEWIKLEGNLKKEFGHCVSSAEPENFMCMASKWHEYAGKRFASLAKEYNLHCAQIAFAHRNFIFTKHLCQSSKHQHLPGRLSWTDYARKYINAFNKMCDEIHRGNPQTQILKNVPEGGYDYTLDHYEQQWAGDMYHTPQTVLGLIERMQIDRMLWPTEVRMQTYLGMLFERSSYSFLLLANIAFGNAMNIGGNLDLVNKPLFNFYQRWLRFYIANREALVNTYYKIEKDIIAHIDKKLNGILVFVLNTTGESLSRQVCVRLDNLGCEPGTYLAFEDDADNWKYMGKIRSTGKVLILDVKAKPLTATVYRLVRDTGKACVIAATLPLRTIKHADGLNITTDSVKSKEEERFLVYRPGGDRVQIDGVPLKYSGKIGQDCYLFKRTSPLVNLNQ